MQVQGEELELKRERGPERQVEQRRRRREGRCEGGGGLHVQFYTNSSLRLASEGATDRRGMIEGTKKRGRGGGRTNTTNNPSTSATIADQIPGAC